MANRRPVLLPSSLPILAIAGQFDEVFPIARMRASVHCSDWVEIEAAGHLVAFDRSAQVAGDVADFLREYPESEGARAMTCPTENHKQMIREHFGRNASDYASSPGHAKGSDLDLLEKLLSPTSAMHVLDIATGAGHTALRIAPKVANVVAADLAGEMLTEVERLVLEREIDNISTSLEDVEQMSFGDARFDAVTCRIAPHHFTDIGTAISEIARVLKPGGIFVLEDSCSPDAAELAEFINLVEQLRDPTHVWSYSNQKWAELCSASGLVIEEELLYRKRRDIEDWMERSSTDPAARDEVRALFLQASPEIQAYFEIEVDGGRAVSYTDDKLLLRARKTG